MSRPKKGRPPALTPEQTIAVRSAYATGATPEDMATELGCSVRTVYRALEGAPMPGAAMLAAPPNADEEPVYAALPTEWSAEDFVRQAAEDARRTAFAARVSGDFRTASKAARDAASLGGVLARLEATRAKGDVVVFTKEELEAGAALVRERLAAAAEDQRRNGGLTCVRCGEALRLADASDGAPAAATGGA